MCIFYFLSLPCPFSSPPPPRQPLLRHNQASTPQTKLDGTGGENALGLGGKVILMGDLDNRSYAEVVSPDDGIPKTLVGTFNEASSPMQVESPESLDIPENFVGSPTSMDFHPHQQSLLLVGTNLGEIALLAVATMKLWFSRKFQVMHPFWDDDECSEPLQALIKDPRVSVNRVIWSPNGRIFGVAYSRQIVQAYFYHGGDKIAKYLEIDAHAGEVNDLAFFHLNHELCMITCGEDKTIKVWDACYFRKLYTLEGHESPVYSVCPYSTKDCQFILSTTYDGKIKLWLYDNLEFHNHVDCEASGWLSTIACSADGTRLFSCGTSKDGESSIVELNGSEGTVIRTYQGFCKRSLDVVQFDTCKNRFLAAVDDFSIKFWDIDHVQPLSTVDVAGVLPARPQIRFNKDGTLLAVSVYENGIEILANKDGIHLLHTLQNELYYIHAFRAFDDASNAESESESEFLPKLTINPDPISAALAEVALYAVANAGRVDFETSVEGGEFDFCSEYGSATYEDIPMMYEDMSDVPMIYDDMSDLICHEATLDWDSSPTSMDFHHVLESLLLVGTNVGDIALWEVRTRKQLVSRKFEVSHQFWDDTECAVPFQALIKDPHASVKRVVWSPDGDTFGVAYSRQIVQAYFYHGGDKIAMYLEIDAHVGEVNDLAFFHLNNQLCMITCGEDKTIKVWNAVYGRKLYTLEGHESPVYSVCPYYTKDCQIIFSTSLDGKMKAWLCDNLEFHHQREASGWCKTLACSADSTRLFSCGTHKDGQSFIAELNGIEGSVKRTYEGFYKHPLDDVQFDSKNRLLAAVDNFFIKFWDIDDVQLLFNAKFVGTPLESLRIRLNKDGTLLAVSANKNEIKIFAIGDLYDASDAPKSSAKVDLQISQVDSERNSFFDL